MFCAQRIYIREEDFDAIKKKWISFVVQGKCKYTTNTIL